MIGRWNAEENGWKSAAGVLEAGPKRAINRRAENDRRYIRNTADTFYVSAQKRCSGIKLNNFKLFTTSAAPITAFGLRQRGRSPFNNKMKF